MKYPGRKEAIEELIEIYTECYADESWEWIGDVLLNGHRGYVDMTDEEIKAEWEDLHEDEGDEGEHEDEGNVRKL